MARDALLEGRSPSDLRFATDGQDLLDYLAPPRPPPGPDRARRAPR